MFGCLHHLLSVHYSNPQGQFCGSHDDHHDDNIKSYAPFNKLNSHTPKNNNNYNTNGRLRRQAAIEASTVCPIKLVATTSFYKQFGVSNVDHTINFLVSKREKYMYMYFENMFMHNGPTPMLVPLQY